jgi:hypothetical protein
MIMDREIKKHETADIGIVLNRLADLLEKTISIFEETRQKAIDNHNYFKGLMESHHEEDSTISEDGVLEKSTNDSMKLVIESSKALEHPINTLTKILTAKMTLDAAKEGNGFVMKPINIDDFK